ncbi:MAG: helix-hairpin-helix domain-containing protein [Desulfobulbaceae bacterium]|nr:helix-hairpin-helix domain-containing protein [Desulfobulbaceae bacterium]
MPLKTFFIRCSRLWFALALMASICFISPHSAAALSGHLNINTANAKDLQMLPFIGRERAHAIVNLRQSLGRFEAMEELLKSPDIGRNTFEAIRPYLKLSGTSTLTETRYEQDVSGQPDTGRSHTSFKTSMRVGTRPGEIIMLPDREYYSTLVHYIENAKNRIDMAMFLFKTTKSPKNKAAKIVQALIAAGKRGVQVRVLLEKSDYNDSINKENRQVAGKLRRNGIQVFFDSQKTTTHTKLVVIDERYSFAGSHNMTHSALAYNHEFSLLIDNRELARKLLGYMEGIKR